MYYSCTINYTKLLLNQAFFTRVHILTENILSLYTCLYKYRQIIYICGRNLHMGIFTPCLLHCTVHTFLNLV